VIGAFGKNATMVTAPVGVILYDQLWAVSYVTLPLAVYV
jgi:hypothetical protein